MTGTSPDSPIPDQTRERPAGPLDALRSLEVLDLSDTVAGAYCAKLLADAGARVLKVEPPSGHPLRRWSVSGSVGRDGDPDGVLFRLLAAGHSSTVADLDSPKGRAKVRDLAAASDLVLETFRPGFLGDRGLGPSDLQRDNRRLTVVSITPFGQGGPRRTDERGEFLLQALIGSLRLHGGSGRRPVAVGGRLGEWAAGPYAAAGALAARARSHSTGSGEHVDVSTLECLALTFLAYPTLFAALPGGTPDQSLTMVPGIEECKDGYVGLATITVQQWHDVLAMAERTDLIEGRPDWNDQRARQREPDAVTAELSPWLLHHTTGEVLEVAAAFRVPAAPVANGTTVNRLPQLQARQLFRANPRGKFPEPRSPFRTTRTEPQAPRPAPHLGQQDSAPPGPARSAAAGTLAGALSLPLNGVRVLDLTAFWAGPFAAQYLATIGADVVKVESVQRPDPMRFSVTVPATTEQWYEHGSLFLSVNINKRGITLDLSRPQGRELLLRLAATADVVMENFTPRVMEQFGLSYEAFRGVQPSLIYVRMPGWGLDGPWRDRPAFASTMEQASGMAWVTGWPDGPPMLPGICDPMAGAHAAFAILAALEQRRETGEGQEIELAMLDVAVNVAVEQVLEWEAYGHLMSRDGNRGPSAAPQGAYRCSADDSWVALAVETDAHWRALCRVMGRPDLSADGSLADISGRRRAHDRLDREIEVWSTGVTLIEALKELEAAGVPAEPVASPYEIDQNEQLLARGFWEEVVHPVVGRHRYPGWPMRLSGGPDRWFRRPAPLLGQHNDDVLGELLGLSTEELAALRQSHVMGEQLLRD